MKITILSSLLTFAAVLVGNAGETAKSPEFERLKTLVGTWKGTTDMGEGPVEMTSRFRLVAAGSVLEERIMEGTPEEMITMYFLGKDGRLALTHYCMMGNRPAMSLKESDAKSLTFDLDAAASGFDPDKESHMHGMVIRFDDADTITTRCMAFMDGKEMPDCEMTLKRVK